MISSSNGSWTIKNEGKLENYSDPYGQLVDDYVFSYHDDEPAYTYEERFQMTAGKLAYDSYYENDWGRNRQNWYDNGATMELGDYYPSNVYDGSYTTEATMQASLSGGATIGYSYSYTQGEVDMTNEVVESENRAQWKMDVADTNDPDGPQSNTVRFDPGSIAEIESAVNGDMLLEVESTGTFEDNWGHHELTNWNSFEQGSDGCLGC